MTTINVFILEDDPGRIRKFKQQFLNLKGTLGKHIEVSHTDDIPTAQKMLREQSFDLVLLDYDLVDEDHTGVIIMAKPRADTGYTLAHWLGMNPETSRKHGCYVTHSLNQLGRERICGAFRAQNLVCTEEPFLWDRSAEVFQSWFVTALLYKDFKRDHDQVTDHLNMFLHFAGVLRRRNLNPKETQDFRTLRLEMDQMLDTLMGQYK